MSSIGGDSSFNLYLNLKPPGTEGQPFAIPGMPTVNEAATTTLLKHLGYSDKDTIGSAMDDVIALAKQLSINFANELGSDQAVQNYLNTLDPSMPSLPPVKAFLVLAERALQQGKIAGFQLIVEEHSNFEARAEAYREMRENSNDPNSNTSVQRKKDEVQENADTQGEDGMNNPNSTKTNTSTSTSTGTDPATGLPKTSYGSAEINKDDYGLGALMDNREKNYNTQTEISGDIADQIAAGRANAADMAVDDATTKATISLGKAEGGNPWLVGNVFVVFLMEFMELQRVLMQNKVVQGKIELAGMNLVVEIAKTTGEIIMNIAQMNQMNYIATAVMSGVALGFSAGGMAYGTKTLAEKIHGKNSSGALHAFERGTVIGQMGGSLNQMATSATQASTALPTAVQEGLKEMLQAYSQLAAAQMNKAKEAVSSSDEALSQLLQTLQKIRDGLEQALASILKH